tara:strand:- start:1176 stop:1733 length:558 start_codon:yes stop_codon:yes gene_type:complete
MAEKIKLISNALILIGDLPVTSLSGNSRAETVANNLYDNIVQNEISKYRWGFATRRAQLALTAEVPIGNEFQNSFQLPPDLIVLTKIDSSANYKMYGDKIHMNSDGPVYAEYVANVREGDWPVYFAKMIEYALAMDFAPSIRDSAASMDANARQYLNASRMARFTDSQQHPVEPLRSRPFIDVRR